MRERERDRGRERGREGERERERERERDLSESLVRFTRDLVTVQVLQRRQVIQDLSGVVTQMTNRIVRVFGIAETQHDQFWQSGENCDILQKQTMLIELLSYHCHAISKS